MRLPKSFVQDLLLVIVLLLLIFGNFMVENYENNPAKQSRTARVAQTKAEAV